MKPYKISKKISQSLIAFCFLCVLVGIGSTKFFLKADVSLPEIGDPKIAPSEITGVGQILDRFLEFLEYFIASIAFINLLVGGIQFIIAGGDAEKAKKAKASILYSIVGVVIAVLSFALTKIVYSIWMK